MNQDKKIIAVVGDIEGWLMMEILEKILVLNNFNVVLYKQDSNDLLDVLQKPNIFLLCGHSNYAGHLYFGKQKIVWDDFKCEHLLTCFYNSSTGAHDDYIRLPGFLEDRTPVLYKIDGLGNFAMEHNDKYRKKLESVRQRVNAQKLNVIDTYLEIMIPFIKKIKIEYELLPTF